MIQLNEDFYLYCLFAYLYPNDNFERKLVLVITEDLTSAEHS